jgi:hypothetical protein
VLEDELSDGFGAEDGAEDGVDAPCEGAGRGGGGAAGRGGALVDVVAGFGAVGDAAGRGAGEGIVDDGVAVLVAAGALRAVFLRADALRAVLRFAPTRPRLPFFAFAFAFTFAVRAPARLPFARPPFFLRPDRFALRAIKPPVSGLNSLRSTRRRWRRSTSMQEVKRFVKLIPMRIIRQSYANCAWRSACVRCWCCVIAAGMHSSASRPRLKALQSSAL